MKIKLFLFALILSLTFQITAQVDRSRLGITLGGTLHFQETEASGLTTKEPTSLQIGVCLNFSLSERIGIQPEIKFQLREKIIESTDGSYIQELSSGGIYFPIILEYKLKNGISLQAGPKFGLFTTSSSLDDDSTGENALDIFPEFDAALEFGPQYNFDFGLFANLRFEYSFTEVTLENGQDGGAIGINIGYFF